ncbi:scaffolding protein [Mycobacterium phage Leozinho]|uniref:Scaffold protein n=2 Tax=Cheoctovirus TaxID=1623281 RepID=B5A6L3_9CAUD|nr:head scaffolding protein [Mycobacterium phage Boomer]YP_009960900.1 head scaffolding protein [Mycobacterium phage OwlsT2W]ACF34068.1 scaffold protein [Mycobacterium phage Boomer]AVR77222.1 scaffolding protein [Mycobacterium phage OwlsT2W]UVK58846.1 scaffolding protein [Mycobacterium phage Leozinho]
MPEEAENTVEDGATTQPGNGDEQQSSFKPITSQDEFDRIIQQRIARERSKFSDYDDLKSKAEELDKIREGEKTELQKLTEQLQSVSSRAEKAERDLLVTSVAAEKGVPASSLTGSTKEELEASADQLIAWRDQQLQQQAPKLKPPAKNLKSGTTGTETADLDPKAAAAEALRRMRAGG